MQILSSQEQPFFKINNVFPAQTVEESTYYALGYLPDNEQPDLLTTEFNKRENNIVQTTIIEDLPLPITYEYYGLHFAGNFLWTLGVNEHLSVEGRETTLSIFKIEIDGDVEDNYTLPIGSIETQDPSKPSYFHLIGVHNSIVSILSIPAERQTEMLYFNLNNLSVTSELVFLTRKFDLEAHSEEGRIWFKYTSDPFQNDNVAQGEGYYALAKDELTGGFVQTTEFDDSMKNEFQLSEETIVNENLTNPEVLFKRSMFIIENSIAVQHLAIGDQSIEHPIFYGLAIYIKKSEFFTSAKIISLILSTLSFLAAIIVKYQEKAHRHKINEISSDKVGRKFN